MGERDRNTDKSGYDPGEPRRGVCHRWLKKAPGAEVTPNLGLSFAQGAP
jgi:hypothetical protein